MNSKFCTGTVVNQAAYDGFWESPEVYSTFDPSSLMFPRDGDYADADGFYIHAITIFGPLEYDATRAEAFNAMDGGQDKANEACLIEFEFHDFATSESRTDFCCQAFIRDGFLDYWFLVKSEALEDSTEEIV